MRFDIRKAFTRELSKKRVTKALLKTAPTLLNYFNSLDDLSAAIAGFLDFDSGESHDLSPDFDDLDDLPSYDELYEALEDLDIFVDDLEPQDLGSTGEQEVELILEQEIECAVRNVLIPLWPQIISSRLEMEAAASDEAHEQFRMLRDWLMALRELKFNVYSCATDGVGYDVVEDMFLSSQHHQDYALVSDLKALIAEVPALNSTIHFKAYNTEYISPDTGAVFESTDKALLTDEVRETMQAAAAAVGALEIYSDRGFIGGGEWIRKIPEIMHMTPSVDCRLLYQEGSSNKFWDVMVEDSAVTTTWGKIGTVGQSKIKEYPDTESALRDAIKQTLNKLASGYIEELIES